MGCLTFIFISLAVLILEAFVAPEFESDLGFLLFWAIGVGVVYLCILLYAIFSVAEENRKKKRSPETEPIGKQSGRWYENKIADDLRRAGFKNVTVTQYSGDYGVDIIAERKGIKWAIQCKHFQKPVSIKAVQEVYAGKKHYGCNAAAVITNNSFTQSARDLANETGVVLMEHDDLSWIDRIEEYYAMTDD